MSEAENTNPQAHKVTVPTMADMFAAGKVPEILFWVGCAGSFDQRYQKVTKAFIRILEHVGTSYAVLGPEESCTGDPARRAGDEMTFQMQALMNIEVLNGYEVKKIVTACPHCFNTIKNEYPALGGNYEVIHHSVFLEQLIASGQLKVAADSELAKGGLTYHDSCYLGRANGIYEAPRKVIDSLKVEIKEMKRSRTKGLCCGAGGAQMFKESEPGNKEINIERTEEALATGAKTIAVNCPFCMTMMSDGVKHKNVEDEVQVFDISELIASANDLNP
ncbi:MAG TPA: (Fe-S)-binding protein [Bacteroidetes bacterium]|nr:(Fe-S)-binding protein [Bacteroidota bacterium]